MCGICGYLQADLQQPINESLLRKMNDAITHRGPDSDGYYVRQGVGLAMRRLSIIDVEGGDQPIFNEDRSLAIVFNGEIYNFSALRDELVKLGHQFQTHTDTECIVHAYETWGTDCVEHLNGMFAFALWDENLKQLFVARDRTGIKPLYYANLGHTFLFGSEIKAILQHPAFPREVDPSALDEYLTFEYVPAPRTIFTHCKKLPCAHALTYQEGNLRLWSYWDYQLEHSEENNQRSSFKDLAHEFRDVLKEVVRQEMVSDVPLGIFLSGGIDSTSIAALAMELNQGQVKTFSIAFDDPSFDESKFARLAAQHLGTQHHELRLTSDTALSMIPRLGQYMDEPLADSSIIPTMLLCKFAREHVTVALGGDGGDEMLAGYSTLQAHRLMQMYTSTVPGTLRGVIQQAVDWLPTSFNNISLDFKLKRFAKGQDLPPEIRHQTWLGSFDTHLKQTVLQKPYLRPRDETYDVVFRHWERTAAQHALNRILYLDMKMYLDGDILPKVDRASMSYSLEVRVPFLNLELMRFLERVPIDCKLERMTTKSLLRRAMQNDLPQEILMRGKKGFNMPVARWLMTDLRDWAHDLLSPARLQEQGIFNPQAVQKILKDHMSRRHDMRKQLWTLLMFQTWWDHWLA